MPFFKQMIYFVQISHNFQPTRLHGKLAYVLLAQLLSLYLYMCVGGRGGPQWSFFLILAQEQI